MTSLINNQKLPSTIEISAQPLYHHHSYPDDIAKPLLYIPLWFVQPERKKIKNLSKNPPGKNYRWIFIASQNRVKILLLFSLIVENLVNICHFSALHSTTARQRLASENSGENRQENRITSRHLRSRFFRLDFNSRGMEVKGGVLKSWSMEHFCNNYEIICGITGFLSLYLRTVRDWANRWLRVKFFNENMERCWNQELVLMGAEEDCLGEEFKGEKVIEFWSDKVFARFQLAKKESRQERIWNVIKRIRAIYLQKKKTNRYNDFIICSRFFEYFILDFFTLGKIDEGIENQSQLYKFNQRNSYIKI